MKPIKWKTFYAILAPTASGLVGFMPAALQVPMPMSLVAGVVAAGVGAATTGVVSKLVQSEPVFVHASTTHRAQIVRWVAVGAVGHTTWVVGVQARPDLYFAWLAVLCLLGGIQYWVSRGQEWAMSRSRQAAIAARQQQAEEDEQRIEQQRQQVEADSAPKELRIGREALRRAKLAGVVELVDWSPIQGTKGVSYSAEKRPDADGTTKINSADTAEALAIQFKKLLGRPIESNWVSVRKQRGAGAYTIDVLTEDVLAELVMFEDSLDAAQATIYDSAWIGQSPYGLPQYLNLLQHGQVVGKTGSGKSALVNAMLAFALLCHNAVVWVGANIKLYELLGDWLEPYVDTDQKMPFDLIASGTQDCAEMLAAAMREGRRRQGIPMSKRPKEGFPALLVYLEEASFSLPEKGKKARAFFDEKNRPISELASMIVRGLDSVNVQLIVLTQRGTQDNYGDWGGTIAGGMGFSFMFMSQDHQELGRIMNDFSLPEPANKGECYYRPGEGDPERVKAAYIQEDNPQKKRLHDGPSVQSVSWARRHTRTELGADAERTIGDWYRGRTRYVTDGFLAYVNGTDPAMVVDAPTDDEDQDDDEAAFLEPSADTGDGSGEMDEDEAKAATMRELDLVLSGLLGGSEQYAPAAAEVAVEPPPVAVLDEHRQAATGDGRTVRERVAEAVEAVGLDGGEAASKGEIASRLAADGGPEVGDKQLANMLTRMTRNGELHRPSAGLYEVPDLDTVSVE